jgi:hypothetical protein
VKRLASGNVSGYPGDIHKKRNGSGSENIDFLGQIIGSQKSTADCSSYAKHTGRKSIEQTSHNSRDGLWMNAPFFFVEEKQDIGKQKNPQNPIHNSRINIQDYRSSQITGYDSRETKTKDQLPPDSTFEKNNLPDIPCKMNDSHKEKSDRKGVKKQNNRNHECGNSKSRNGSKYCGNECDKDNDSWSNNHKPSLNQKNKISIHDSTNTEQKKEFHEFCIKKEEKNMGFRLTIYK